MSFQESTAQLLGELCSSIQANDPSKMMLIMLRIPCFLDSDFYDVDEFLTSPRAVLAPSPGALGRKPRIDSTMTRIVIKVTRSSIKVDARGFPAGHDKLAGTRMITCMFTYRRKESKLTCEKAIIPSFIDLMCFN